LLSACLYIKSNISCVLYKQLVSLYILTLGAVVVCNVIFRGLLCLRWSKTADNVNRKLTLS